MHFYSFVVDRQTTKVDKLILLLCINCARLSSYELEAKKTFAHLRLATRIVFFIQLNALTLPFTLVGSAELETKGAKRKKIELKTIINGPNQSNTYDSKLKC